ncbi:hypothetical protein GmHk_08G021973 [Glycine max]|nr:hypothetical protein GmHk_08G021973 [Glycine max]
MLSCSLMDSMTCRQPKPDGVEATVELPMVSSLPTVHLGRWWVRLDGASGGAREWPETEKSLQQKEEE